MLRTLNDSDASGTVMVYAIDDAGARTGPATFTLNSRAPAVSPGDCSVGLLVGIGESCTYPGTEDAFSVNVRGRGRFLDRLAGIRIRINNETINGQVYDFEASHQGDGVWRIDRIGGSTEVTTGTLFVDPDILTPSDPATFSTLSDAGRGSRLMFDRREGQLAMWVRSTTPSAESASVRSRVETT